MPTCAAVFGGGVDRVPACAVAPPGLRRGAGGVDLDLLARPDPAVAQHRVHEAVVDPVEREPAPGRENLDGGLRRRHVDEDVGTEARRPAARVVDGTQHEPAEERKVDAHEVADAGRRRDIVDSLRRVQTRKGGRVDEPTKRGDGAGGGHEVGWRRRIQEGALPHDPGGRVGEFEGVEVGPAKDVGPDIEGVGVDAQGRVVGQARGITGRQGGVHVEVVELPARGAGDRRGIADRQQDSVRNPGRRPDVPGHVDDGREPSVGKAVVTHPRIGDEVVRTVGPHRVPEREVRCVEGSHDTVGLGMDSNTAVHVGEELGGSNCAHGVRRLNQGLAQRDARKGGSDDLGKARLAQDGRLRRPARRCRRVGVLGQDPAPGRTPDLGLAVLDLQRTLLEGCLPHDLGVRAVDWLSAIVLCPRPACRKRKDQGQTE